MSESPYKIFFDWLFDSNINSEFPKPKYDETGKQITIDLLKYNSPITSNYLIKIFMKNQRLNYYLNEYFNNINLWAMPKEELFKFIKKCVIDFRVKRNSIVFFQYNRKNVLFEKLQDKLPMFKKDDVMLICENVEKSEYKDIVYESLGINLPKKQTIKKKDKKKYEKISLKEFIQTNFVCEEVLLKA